MIESFVSIKDLTPPVFKESLLELAKIAENLRKLLDTDPLKALEEANKLDGNINYQLLKAAILVDGGAILKNVDAIRNGVDIYESVHELHPENAEITYNLANGVHSLALANEYIDFTWYQDTYFLRLRARKLFYSVKTNDSVSFEIISQALTNLANLHWSSYRWVEAYDFYVDALQFDNKNGIASSGALKMLRYALSNGIGNHELLRDEIKHLAVHVNSNTSTIEAYGGVNAVTDILNEKSGIPAEEKFRRYESKDDFEDFVLRNNLTLSPTIHLVEHKSERWDELNIASVSSSVKTCSQIPEIFPMFNVMKSDYILARKIFYDAINNSYIDTGTYSDTLDYACYGVQTSALTLAQRIAFDVLDKIAVASISYLKIGGAKQTTFRTAWFRKNKSNDGIKILSPKILAEIESGNTALLALAEISNDLSDEGGYLKEKQSARNSSTHRFTILHDMGYLSESESRCLEHFNYEEFQYETLSTLKLARSALLYIVQMIMLREGRLSEQSDGLLMPMTVPSHEYIRGLDE